MKKALQSIELYCGQIEVILRYFRQQIKEPCNDSVTRFDKHIGARYTVLMFLKGNINEAIGKLERARECCEDVQMDKEPVSFLVPASKSFPLAKLVIKSQLYFVFRNRDPLKILQLINDPASDIPMELKGLESLGLTHVYTLNTHRTRFGFFKRIRGALFRGFD